tara:strand:- start:78 stop:545 length:468 start_codon:yes stop_codon:yes gene_type:complete
MSDETNYISPSQSMIELPHKMRPGGDLELRSFRGIWCDETENNGPDLSQTAILLIQLGLIKAREEERETLGQKKPDTGPGGGYTDIGQVTGDGKFGLSFVIQTLWPDQNRTPTQLVQEIQWLVFEGYEALKEEADQYELMKKLISPIVESSNSEQ